MLTICIATNGRSTFEYCERSVLETCGDTPVIVVKNKSRKRALELFIEQCKTPYFLRVDDDFIFHPKAINYIKYCAHTKINPNMGMMYWMLWEDCSEKVVKSVKMYSINALKQIGGFQYDKYSGKEDVDTRKAIGRKFEIKPDKSVVAIHSVGTKKEELDYVSLWERNAPCPSKYEKLRLKYRLAYTKSIEYQYGLRTNFIDDLNKQKNTNFWKYLSEHQY
jgi:hypothetical protein